MPRLQPDAKHHPFTDVDSPAYVETSTHIKSFSSASQIPLSNVAMTENRYSQRIPRRTWDTHKNNILRLYLLENRPLNAVKDMMHSEYGFSATKSQYETRLKKWSCYKYAAAHDRRAKASVLDDQRTERLVTERYTQGPESDAPTESKSLDTLKLHFIKRSTQFIHFHGTFRSGPHLYTTPLISSSVAIDDRLKFRSFSMHSVNLQSSTSQHEFESLIHQDPTWASNTAVAADDLFHSALHTNIDVDTSSASSVPSHNMEQPGDLDSLSFFSSIMYARAFIGQNDIRSSNLNILPDDSSLRETIHPDGLSIPDFATSMFPVISRMFPRAASSPHLVILGNSSAFDFALRNISHPSTLQLVRQQSIDHQIIYMIFHRLINDSDTFRVLDEPKTELDQVFRTGILYFFSLGKRVLSGLIDSTPSPFNLALEQNIFRAALVLNDGTVLSDILEMSQLSLVNQRLTVEGTDYYPLEYAGLKERIQATQALLDHGADPNLQTDREDFLRKILGTPWDSEARNPRIGVQILRLLIDHGLESNPRASVNRMQTSNGDELLVLATHCLDKSFETFFQHRGLPTVLLQRQWDDPSSKTLKAILDKAFMESNGQQRLWNSILTDALSAAVLRNHRPAFELLLSTGAIPNIHCLISAAQSNDVQALKTFLRHGLNPNTKGEEATSPNAYDVRKKWDREEDCTALSESIMNPSRGVFQVLQEQGFVLDLSRHPAGFASAFVAACQVGDSTLIEQLLSLPNFPRTQGKLARAVEFAMKGDQYHIIEKLLSVGMKATPKSLELAIQKKQLPIVILLARHVDIARDLYWAQPDEQENAMIWEAIRWGDQTAIEHVVRAGHPINVCDRMDYGELRGWELLTGVKAPAGAGLWYYTPLGAAIMENNTYATRILMAYGVRAVLFNSHSTSYQRAYLFTTIDSQAAWIITPLVAAAATNDLPLIREVLRIGADPFDNSALFVCAMIDSKEEVVKLLLSAFKTRYPDGAQSFGSDALYRTITRGNMGLLKLLSRDVDLTGPVLTDDYHERSPGSRNITAFTSPLGEAVRQHAENKGTGGALDHLLPLVKDLNAVVHRTYKHGSMTSLLYAIFLGSLATVQKLHQAGADISLPAEWQIPRTPLQAAAQAGSRDIVEYLLNHDVDPNEAPADRAGATALQLAAISGNIGVAAVLLEAKAKVNAPPAFCDGRTAFEGATEHGRIEMMMFLVRHGADLLSNNGAQYRRAVDLAEDNLQPVAKKLATDLYEQLLASQVTNFIGMGGDAWAGPDVSSFGGLRA
ncbi:hypothetical protein IG631_11299 [Alternaria alternata]|nr:hypothetical protein IG631_11299 [Alternaria alternata]